MLYHPVSQRILDLEQRAAELTAQLSELRQRLASGIVDDAIMDQQAHIMADLDLTLVNLKAAQQQWRQQLLDLGFPPVIGYLSRHHPTDRDHSAA